MRWQDVTITPRDFRRYARPCFKAYIETLRKEGLTECDEVPAWKVAEILEAHSYGMFIMDLMDMVISKLNIREMKEQVEEIVDFIAVQRLRNSYTEDALKRYALDGNPCIGTKKGRVKTVFKIVAKEVERRIQMGDIQRKGRDRSHCRSIHY